MQKVYTFNSAQALHLLETNPQKTSQAIKIWLEHQHKKTLKHLRPGWMALAYLTTIMLQLFS